jgi:3-oxoacyl-[acyl-carrier protein] reductase
MFNVKTVLVTGATGNIGRACNMYFTDHNWEVVQWSKRDAECVHPVDLARWHSSSYALHKTSKLDMVIMAHGMQVPSLIGSLTDTLWSDIIANNLTSCVALTTNLVQLAKLNPGALIVYCSSIQANTPRTGRGAYAAAKAGLEAFSKTVAVELAPQGVRSIALRLGQLTKTMGGVQFSEAERVKLEARALLPWVDPDAVAKFCYDLYDQPSMTGCVIDFDSGHGISVW